MAYHAPDGKIYQSEEEYNDRPFLIEGVTEAQAERNIARLLAYSVLRSSAKNHHQADALLNDGESPAQEGHCSRVSTSRKETGPGRS
jgi:hypothetical protein